MSNAPSHPDPPPADHPRGERRWRLVGLLAAIATVGTVAVVVGLIVFNNQRRLTPEKLADARARWERAGVRDYEIEVRVGGGTQAVYRVEVRGGQVVRATQNGLAFDRPERAEPWTVAGLFDILANDLARDAQPGSPAAYTQVRFDPHDGHLVRYLRTTPTQKLVLEVRLERKP
jgi:hypothetical protein